ncbi:Cro/CI family transcriptional regulator [Mixta calida]|uniref:Cro/CI family transcriptional regulator n=1 Tax=Erwiniaceae TaxID=1903409 RepID=UPI00290ABEB1|nr:Cro/CI family transcriptional regulator [Mixta calida]MDU4291127.1 Cro/CI family transcriptional regulator [Mixta calida]
MKTADVIAFFGTKAATARALNCHRLAIYQWGDNVPYSRQYEVEVKTGGALKSDYTLALSARTRAGRKKRKKADA